MSMMAAPADVHLEGQQAKDMSLVELIPTLPLETRCPPFPLRQYAGYWLPEWVFPEMEAVYTRFEPRPSDIILASFPKCGTTWLKALAFATVNRADHPPSSQDHPLRRHGPHECVTLLESRHHGGDGMYAALPSPRLLNTHMPYSHLPDAITADSSGCRIVYICRDPKDAFVSAWLFFKKVKNGLDAKNGAQEGGATPYTIEEALRLFCEGRSVTGPQWHHVLEYWEESRRRLAKLLFLHYEEILLDSARNVKKMAEFLGCPFSAEEEAAGVVDAIVHLCSFNHLTSLQVNKTGVTESGFLDANNDSFFRKGVAGDWRNHLSLEMATQLDKVVDDALRRTGFSFATVSDPA